VITSENKITSVQLCSSTDWQHQLSHCISDFKSLCEYLHLEHEQLAFSDIADQQFALKVPLPYAQRMQKGNIHDPLLRQVLPDPRELEHIAGFSTDPLQEASANQITGLIHKYKNRVLITLSGACAINCRYCFRRHFPYTKNKVGSSQWQQILDYIKADMSIEEVIFSGGDPLATSDKRLSSFINDLSAIKQLQRLRIHSRLPVVIPQRITPDLCEILRNTNLQTVLVIHANHANEFDNTVKQALTKLRDADVTVLNQAVLLKGINDSVALQKALHTASFKAGALPYYLFVLDPVQGAAHFDISDAQAQQLVIELQRELPGYLVPKLAREIPGKPNKTLLPVRD
jgi:EF-P beta-lysylation protein EpmB